MLTEVPLSSGMARTLTNQITHVHADIKPRITFAYLGLVSVNATGITPEHSTLNRDYLLDHGTQA